MQARTLLFVACLFVATINASSWGPKRVCPVSWNCFGFWEYLPDSYNTSNSDKHPVIVTLHGLGEYGNGQAPDINKIISTSLPKYINQGQWPASWDFLVFAPQDFNGWWNAARVTTVLDWIAANYTKADLNRVYLTGYSAGGGGTWDFASNGNAQRVAAIAPICGSGGQTAAGVSNMVANNVPVWAFHNSGDPTVGVGVTNGWINALNAAGIVPTAQKTIWTSNSHDAWTPAYNPATSPMYAWFLTHSRGGPAPTNGPTAPPTLPPTPSPCASPSVGTGTGLMGVYHTGTNFTAAVGARIDSTINFSWGSTGIPTLPTTSYSVRWTGTIRAKFSGVHTFYTNSDDGVRLKINGGTVIENWTDHGPTENSGTIDLTAGTSYPVVLEFYNSQSGAVIALSWSHSCITKEIVPTTQLTPGSLNIC